jgi:hypothetical protein
MFQESLKYHDAASAQLTRITACGKALLISYGCATAQPEGLCRQAKVYLSHWGEEVVQGEPGSRLASTPFRRAGRAAVGVAVFQRRSRIRQASDRKPFLAANATKQTPLQEAVLVQLLVQLILLQPKHGT